jgi:hypothetical protein
MLGDDLIREPVDNQGRLVGVLAGRGRMPLLIAAQRQ